MKKTEILALIRHFLTVIGGALAGNGIIASSDVETGVGAIVILIGLVWSIKQKGAQKKEVEIERERGRAEGLEQGKALVKKEVSEKEGT